MRRTLITVTVGIALVGGAIVPSFGGHASAASPAKSHVTALDKTRFAVHLGVAFFAVHHVYTRYRAGAFNKGAPHRTRSIVANGALLLIGYHEAKVAYGIAASSKSKTLHAVIAPLNALMNSLSRVGGSLNRGQYNARDISKLEGQTSATGSAAASAGYGVKDRPVALPAGS